jgi:GT2 family glycosyltransferase
LEALLGVLAVRNSPPPGPAADPVSITVAVCTRDRPKLLARCLGSVNTAMYHAGAEAIVEVVVVDNASPNDLTRRCAEEHGARCVREPVPGLNVARNRAVTECDTEIIAFIDDDVVVDRMWLRTMVRAFAADRGIDAVTGGVLAFRLDTPARLDFERRGGFSLGWKPAVVTRTGNDLPFRADIGSGCNMAFRMSALATIGPFDEALDTGRPLPGGGDLDILIRAASEGRVVYEPSALVFHEHREQWRQLHYQYYTWGLSFGALIAKWYRRSLDQRVHLLWTAYAELRGYASDFVQGPKRTGRYRRWHCVLLTVGFAVGLAGAYGRSQTRMQARRRAAAELLECADGELRHPPVP